jgi:hypothetical protein
MKNHRDRRRWSFRGRLVDQKALTICAGQVLIPRVRRVENDGHAGFE